MTILEECFRTGNLHSMDLVEVNTNLAPYEDGTKTLEAAKALILSAMGYYRGGRPPLEQYLSRVKGKLPEW
jgi:arginase family enzyme